MLIAQQQVNGVMLLIGTVHSFKFCSEKKKADPSYPFEPFLRSVLDILDNLFSSLRRDITIIGSAGTEPPP